MLLAETLLQEKKLTLVGTMNSNRIGIPAELKANNEREVRSSIFAHHKRKTIVSYCPKNKKAVILLSTMHNDQAIDRASGELRKPEIITLYNKTKVGVDVLDQMCEKYDVSRNTKRWPMVIFFYLINIAAINASRIHKFNNMPNEGPKRRLFLENLAWELLQPQIKRRLEYPTLPVELKQRARRILGIEELPRQPLPQDNKVGRCFLCGRQRDRSTRKCCQMCGHRVCPEHCTVACLTCFTNM